MTHLRVIGGTDIGDVEADPVWEDEVAGSARLLKKALAQGITRVALMGIDADGSLYVASTARSAEETMGFFQRAIHHLDRFAQEGGEEPQTEGNG